VKAVAFTSCTASETIETDARVPPCDLDAEGMVIGFALIHGIDELGGDLDARHFYADANRFVYEAIQELSGALPAPLDTASIRRYLEDRKHWAAVGSQYLARLYDTIPASAAPHARSHAAAIVECWKRRVLIAAFREAEAKLYAGDLNSQQAWDHVKEAVRAQRKD